MFGTENVRRLPTFYVVKLSSLIELTSQSCRFYHLFEKW